MARALVALSRRPAFVPDVACTPPKSRRNGSGGAKGLGKALTGHSSYFSVVDVEELSIRLKFDEYEYEYVREG